MIKKTIIPVAGGKGGVGKSLISANLSIALAQLGHSTVAIDLDLGGSNLHFMLGLKNDSPGIGDYLNRHVIRFEDLCVQTEWPHLKFIPGDGTTPLMANISYAGKLKIISEIRNLSADYIILDLGAGSSFNTLDFFRIENRGLLVTATDRISVINMLSFLKSHLFRTIDRNLIKNIDSRLLVQELLSGPVTRKATTINSVLKALQASDPEAVKKIMQICKRIQPRIIYNMVHDRQELSMVDVINKSTKNVMSIVPQHIGAIFYDPIVFESIRQGQPLLKYDATSGAAQSIFSLANKIGEFWGSPSNETAKAPKNN